ncbi:MAG: saccharopine dehydrogenase NADP-binding domain-containing protein [Bacteroidales bacterium]|nr:saccharopine dehydrogenase NADP-binding domain-containing protein [Bacteroidales bacterium]MCF8345153.1 saccharopine dehydrogenase NADP-binding domain-containing protein [Bacteroidales bacterium]MCF8352193.1 saccharopine dehydrogenase NADP-binding domain-containing protein [Bacteroidales bacterium]MCF8375005.1 saccharopine dehydrogenase NADP-binding domain-containing protein [Bacteroidales bacterium]MCF8402195.1 saccharopine dehydrogenase NADP-binding domain-containing protein [Bacteroidales
MKILVLGCGLVGRPMALDLANDKQFKVTVVDRLSENLKKIKHKGIQTARLDASNKIELVNTARDFDMILSAVPGSLGFQTLKTLLECGKRVIDIAFFPEELFELNEVALQNNALSVSDIGVAPGLSNILVAHAARKLDKASSAKIYVGGLPKIRTWPWEYKAVFSPADVLEEYTRPARYVENGRLVVKPALTEPEYLDFPNVGTLEAFNSDGLRSLIKTMDLPDMIEKTLRYPGHIDKIRVLKESGFLEPKEIEIGGKAIKPLDLTSKLLFKQWKLNEGEEDLTVMKVIVEGVRNEKPTQITYDLYDEYHAETGIHSMARTTGYTATMTMRMLAEGMFDETGAHPPEKLAEKPECVDYILKGLKERGVKVKEIEEEL